METKFQRVYNVVNRSIDRSNHFSKQFSLNIKKPVSTLIPDSFEYFMSYSIGTPPFKTYGIMDTGSPLVWLQCLPCKTCYNQTSPIFNPLKSSSYETIRSSSRRCKLAKDLVPSCSQNKDVCQYNITYGGEIKSQGDLSLETLTLDSTSGSFVVFSKIVIGCGHISMLPILDRGSGIVGMGSGPMSLIQQLGSSIDRKFSYCLNTFNSDFDESNFSNKLNFGNAAIISGERVVSTPMIKFKGAYAITLEAFSVENQRIEYEGANTYNKTIIIDSGTPLTMLPPHFHSKLESAVAKLVKLHRIELPNRELSLCYNTTLEQLNNVPIITAHFSSADVKLNSNNTFIEFQKGTFCFAFIPSRGSIIFGSIAQHNYLVGYDLENNVISFKPTDCTKY
ncbi:hypothetical protein RYX36_028344 [Vicia faba]